MENTKNWKVFSVSSVPSVVKNRPQGRFHRKLRGKMLPAQPRFSPGSSLNKILQNLSLPKSPALYWKI